MAQSRITAETPSDSVSWRVRWLALRNRLYASAKFQRWASGFVLTRPIARRRTRALFDLVAGFVYSQVLSACVALDLFEILAPGPQPVSVLAMRCRLSDAAMERLLKAAAALDLIQPLKDGRYALGPLGAALRANPSVLAMIVHHRMLYADLADPVALLRGELAAPQLAGYWAYAKNLAPAAVDSAQVAAYSALMAESQALVADEILDAYPLAGHRCLLDVGGGEGVFLSAAGRRTPGLQLILFDLPAVVQRAPARLTAGGLIDRATLVGGSFFSDALPHGADIAALVRVLHDHDDAEALAILRRVHAVLPPGGTVMIAEPMSGSADVAPMADAYFGFYLAAMGSGQARTPEVLSQMLQTAGFRDARLLATRTPLLIRVLIART